MGKLRHQLTLDKEATEILNNVDNKSGFAEEAIKFYSQKELHLSKISQEVPKMTNVRVTR